MQAKDSSRKNAVQVAEHFSAKSAAFIQWTDKLDLACQVVDVKHAWGKLPDAAAAENVLLLLLLLLLVPVLNLIAPSLAPVPAQTAVMDAVGAP